MNLAPDNPALYFLRGTTLLRLGRRDEAAEDFVAGLRLDPGNATLQQLLDTARQEPGATVAAGH